MPLKEPTINKQHAVPQNIMDVEFKLIGDLTMRQFFYVLTAAGIAYGTYLFPINDVFKYPIILTSLLLGLGLAFVPVEDRGLDEWVVNFVKAINEDNQKVWRKRAIVPGAFLHENISLVKQELITLAPTTSRRRLERYLQYQPDTSDVDPLDIPEQAYIEKVRAAYPTTTTTKTKVALEDQVLELPTKEKPKKVGEKKKKDEEEKKEVPKKEKLEFEIPASDTYAPLIPITPDRHSGRLFTNLLSSKGEIILPIRGERVLDTTESKEIIEDTEEKAKQLKSFLKQLKESEGVEIPETGVEEKAEEVIEDIEKEKEQIKGEIEKIKAEDGEEESKLKQLLRKQVEKEKEEKELKKKVEELKLKTPTRKFAKAPEPEAFPRPTVPNIVSGVVRDPNKRGISNVLIIIKSAHNDPIRAIKTNALGQFAISNPMPNGTYKINVDVNEETGLSFDIIGVEAKGELIPPMEFVGK